MSIINVNEIANSPLITKSQNQALIESQKSAQNSMDYARTQAQIAGKVGITISDISLANKLCSGCFSAIK